MQELPFEVEMRLAGWSMLWAELASRPTGVRRLAELRQRVAENVRSAVERESLTQHPPVAALRKLFRAAGCDPTRYRPSSEALLRRLTRGDSLPAILPLVDLNNCLSAELAVPCCVMAEGAFFPPFEFRAGRAGEGYESLRGPFNAEKKPLLLDARGPCDTPITGSQRVKVEGDTERAWLVAYLPSGIVHLEEAAAKLVELIDAAPVAEALTVGGV